MNVVIRRSLEDLVSKIEKIKNWPKNVFMAVRFQRRNKSWWKGELVVLHTQSAPCDNCRTCRLVRGISQHRLLSLLVSVLQQRLLILAIRLHHSCSHSHSAINTHEMHTVRSTKEALFQNSLVQIQSTRDEVVGNRRAESYLGLVDESSEHEVRQRPFVLLR